MGSILKLIHSLETLQIEMRVQQQWEAARSLDNTIEVLKAELTLKIAEYESTFEKRKSVGV